MKILRLLNNKKIIIFFFIFLLNSNSIAEDQPIDIWNIDKKKFEENLSSEKNIIEENDSKKKLFEIHSFFLKQKNWFIFLRTS